MHLSNEILPAGEGGGAIWRGGVDQDPQAFPFVLLFVSVMNTYVTMDGDR